MLVSIYIYAIYDSTTHALSHIPTAHQQEAASKQDHPPRLLGWLPYLVCSLHSAPHIVHCVQQQVREVDYVGIFIGYPSSVITVLLNALHGPLLLRERERE